MQRSDNSLLDAYDEVYAIIALKTIGFRSGSSTRVFFEDDDYEDDYVYDEDGRYLGRAPREMPLSDRYYISSRRYDNLSMSGSGSSSSSSSSSQSSSGTSKPGSTVAGSGSSSSGSGAVNPTGGAITADAARSATSSAVSAARSAGQATASVKFQDRASISAAALKAMPGSAGGMPDSLIADTMSGKSVVGRLTINPASAASLTGDISLGVYVDSSRTGATKNLFGQWFSNRVEVVSLAQKAAFGMRVRIAAKVNLSGLNTDSLRFYSYDKATNRYNAIASPSYSIDSVGYLHFYTSAAGEIVVTDRALARR
jgi:hypothetical protein